MTTFIIVLIMVLVCVDLFVRFVLEPWILAKENKTTESTKPKLDPEFELAIETMYDGGQPHSSETSSDAGNDENTVKNDV